MIVRPLAGALLCLVLPSPTAGLVHADPSRDVRIDPRLVNVVRADLPREFNAMATLFSLERPGSIYADNYGPLEYSVVYFSQVGGKRVTVRATVSVYPSSAEAMGACCASGWKNASAAYHPARVGDAGYSSQSGPDSSGLVTQRMSFRQGQSVARLWYANTAAAVVPKPGQGPGLEARLAQLIDLRIKAARSVKLDVLLPVLVPPSPPNGVQRPNPTNLVMNTDASVTFGPHAVDATLMLSATTAPGAQCTATVQHKPDKQMDIGAAAQTAATGSATWSWRENQHSTLGVATVSCVKHGALGLADVYYLISR